MASTSITSICNAALQRLGAARILDITDDTRNGRACNACYDRLRRQEMRKHYWRFAIERVTLAPISGFTSDEYAYAFRLPSDYLRMIKPRDPTLDWQLEGDKILTSQSDELNLRYIADKEDPSKFDPNFSEMLSLAMAVEMCEEITQSNNKIEGLKRDYKDARMEARRLNAFETIPAEPEEDSWLTVRL